MKKRALKIGCEFENATGVIWINPRTRNVSELLDSLERKYADIWNDLPEIFRQRQSEIRFANNDIFILLEKGPRFEQLVREILRFQFIQLSR